LLSLLLTLFLLLCGLLLLRLLLLGLSLLRLLLCARLLRGLSPLLSLGLL